MLDWLLIGSVAKLKWLNGIASFSEPYLLIDIILFLYICQFSFVVDASQKGVQPDQLIFSDIAMKNEHIRRSALADLFLDTWVILR